MNITCSGCGGQTKPKQIKTKRGPTTVYECLGSCVNDKGYKLGTFAPRGPSQAAPAQGGQGSPEAIALLKRIASATEAMAAHLGLKNDPLERQAEEQGF